MFSADSVARKVVQTSSSETHRLSYIWVGFCTKILDLASVDVVCKITDNQVQVSDAPPRFEALEGDTSDG